MYSKDVHIFYYKEKSSNVYQHMYLLVDVTYRCLIITQITKKLKPKRVKRTYSFNKKYFIEKQQQIKPQMENRWPILFPTEYGQRKSLL